MNSSLYYRACRDCGFDHSYEPEAAKAAHEDNAKAKPQNEKVWEVWQNLNGKLNLMQSFDSRIKANIYLSNIVFDQGNYFIKNPDTNSVSIAWVLNQLAGMGFQNSAGQDAYNYIKRSAKAAGIDV